MTAIQPGFVRTEMTEKNQHMMFVMDAEPAARLIAWAIWRKKKVFSFPKRMRALLWLAKWAPDRLIERMIKEGVGGRRWEVRPVRSRQTDGTGFHCMGCNELSPYRVGRTRFIAFTGRQPLLMAGLKFRP